MKAGVHSAEEAKTNLQVELRDLREEADMLRRQVAEKDHTEDQDEAKVVKELSVLRSKLAAAERKQ